jgi:hypothetical protein
MINIPGFYPTTKSLINKLVSDIDFKSVYSILEPEAGKGDIVDGLMERMKIHHYNGYGKEYIPDIDTIEINENLRHILKGKGYRVVHDDFLTFQTYKHYDLIIMNPPFDEGEKHLLKALEMQQNGGIIRCLINAETIRNPFSNTRKDLIRKLDEYDAEIDFIKDAFTDAERKTGVEIAMIKVNIPAVEKSSIILDGLKRDEYFKKSINNSGEIIDADPLVSIVNRYNFEIQAGLKLIDECEAMKPYLQQSIKENSGVIFELKVDGGRSQITRNQYIQLVRSKYWKTLFMSDVFMNHFTAKLRNEYINRINELQQYDFSLYNIYSIKAEVVKSTSKSIEDTIIKLFDDFSYQNHWDDTSKNIHYYNGWKSNKAWFINKRIVVPRMSAFDDWDGRFQANYRVKDKLTDIEKVFDYLDGGRTDHVNLEIELQRAQEAAQTSKIQLKYFKITFYKKGTAHIEFTNLELLKKFNLFGSQRKGWLPPSYGKAKYEDMTTEEQTIINEFEGPAEYQKVMANKDYYICESVGLPMLESKGNEAA